MRKRLLTTLIAMLILTSLTGCWDRREVTDLAIAVAIGIDKNDDGEYIISTQILNPAENAPTIGGGAGYDSPVTTYTMTGRIMFEALRKLIQDTPEQVILSHLRMVVIGEDVAKEGIYDFIDFLSRDHEVRTDYYIVVAKEHTAKETLSILTSLKKIPAVKLFTSLEDSSEIGAVTRKVRLTELIDDIVSEGTQPTLTGVTIKGDTKAGAEKDNVEGISQKALLSYGGIAVFRESKLIGWLNEQESKGFNYIKDNVQRTFIVFEINDGKIGIELSESKSDIESQFQDDKLNIKVKITGEANVAEVNTKLNLMSSNVFTELEEKTNNEIRDVVLKVISSAQEEFRSDIFGFGEIVHKKNPKEWAKLKESWVESFPDVPVDVHVDIKLRGTGTISDPFYNELIKE